MEGQETMKIYSGIPILVHLMNLREDSRLPSSMKDQIMILEEGLQFLAIYKQLLSLSDRDISRMDATEEREDILKIGVLALDTGEFEDWDTLVSELLNEINSYKPSIREDCSIFSEGVFIGDILTANFLPKFMGYVDISMSKVLQLKGDMMNPDEKMKFESYKDKSDMLRIVFDYVKESNTSYTDFLNTLNSWVWNVAYLCLFYWVLDENMASDEKNVTLSKFYQNFYFSHPKDIEWCVNFLKNNNVAVEERCKVVGDVVFPEVTRMCLSYLKDTKPSVDKRREALAVIIRLIESLHHNLRGYLPKEDIETLSEAMTFLITFVMDPPSEHAKEGELVLFKTREALKKAGTLIISLGLGEKDEADTVKATNFLLHDFFDVVSTIKAEVRKAYSLIFLDPSFNFPRFNILNLFDSSIGKFKEFASCSPNLPILITLERELVVLTDLLKASNLKYNFVLELQNEYIGSKDLWTQIANVAYQVDRMTRSNSYENGLGLYTFLLLNVQEEIKNLVSKVRRIKDKHVQDSYQSRNEMNLNHTVPLKSNVQEIDEVVVGFEGKAKELRD